MTWTREGGGCFVAGKCAKKKCACDDDYVRRRRGKPEERAVVLDTMKRHFDMPERVESLADLRKLKGVCEVKRQRAR